VVARKTIHVDGCGSIKIVVDDRKLVASLYTISFVNKTQHSILVAGDSLARCMAPGVLSFDE